MSKSTKSARLFKTFLKGAIFITFGSFAIAVAVINNNVN